jgi:homeobox protein ESX1
LILGVLALLSGLAGCRCAPGFNSYADFIDDLGDDEWAFDQWYNPRLDISRAGKPDWCSPLNRQLAPCRCCNQRTWNGADPCWLYPRRHPYWYPGQAVPPPGMTTSPTPVAEPALPPIPPATPVYETPPAPPSTPALPPNPFEDPAPNPAPPLPAAPFPDPQAFQPPVEILPVFEAPL